MKLQLGILIFIVGGLALVMAACTGTQPDNRAADEAAIRAADVAFSRVVEAKELDSVMACYADDAVAMFPNTPMLTTRDDIRKSFTEFFAVPGLAMKWKVTKVEAARSGDLGYTLGTYEMTMNDAKGMPFTDHGKYTTVWKKQADKSWKVIVDMSNTDLPAMPPPSK